MARSRIAAAAWGAAAALAAVCLLPPGGGGGGASSLGGQAGDAPQPWGAMPLAPLNLGCFAHGRLAMADSADFVGARRNALAGWRGGVRAGVVQRQWRKKAKEGDARPAWEMNRPFEQPSVSRKRSQRGAKGHFHLLDKYIRRIDSLVPEDMEHLVKPLKSRDALRDSTVLQLRFPDAFGAYGANPDVELEEAREEAATMAAAIDEKQVRSLLEPLVPTDVALGWRSRNVGAPEIYVRFANPSDCKAALDQSSGTEVLLGGLQVKASFASDHKWKRVTEGLSEGRDGEAHYVQDRNRKRRGRPAKKPFKRRRIEQVY